MTNKAVCFSYRKGSLVLDLRLSVTADIAPDIRDCVTLLCSISRSRTPLNSWTRCLIRIDRLQVISSDTL